MDVRMETPPPVETIEETAMTPELDAAIRECLCACFPADKEFFSGARAWHGSPPAYSLVGRAEGRVAGHVGIIVRDIRVAGRTVRIAGIQNMAVLPDWRKSGLGSALITGAMDQAARRGIPFGVLFCIPELERYYARYGWTRHDVDVRMDYAGQRNIPIPGKNICMVKLLAGRPFPDGDIHLQGADW